MQILEQPSSQCIPSSQGLICSWVAACTVAIGRRACSGRMYNVITSTQLSHILISNNTSVVISKQTRSTVSDDVKVSLRSDNRPLKLHFEILEACCCHLEAFWIWAPGLNIIIRSLPDIIEHIIGWRWEDGIQRKVAAATMHRRLGSRCFFGLLAMISDARKHWVVQFDHQLYPSRCSIDIQDWGHITGMCTTMPIRLFTAAPNLSDCLAGVCETRDCSIHNWQIGRIDDWYNYCKYRFIISRPAPSEQLCIVFTHPLASNVRIHIDDGKAKGFDK